MLNENTSKTILITGGTGFVGTHLFNRLEDLGFTNIHLTNFNYKPDQPDHMHAVDLSNSEATLELFKFIKPDWIFHLASHASVGDSFDKQAEILKKNIEIQISVLEALRNSCPTARFLNVSSAEIYGKSLSEDELPISEIHAFRPINPYAVSKLTQDALAYMYATVHNLDIILARPFNHIGEGQSAQFVVAAFAEQIAQVEKGLKSEVLVGNTEPTRDFTDVKDVVEAYILLIEQGVKGEAYNIGSGQGVSIAQILEKLISMSVKNIKVITDDTRLRPSDLPVMIADSTKIGNLGWSPKIPLDETLKRIIDYWRNKI